MSVVLITAMDNFAIIMGDGRVIGENGIIVKEDYRKVRRINDNVCIGFAGSQYFCEKSIAEIKSAMTFEQVINSIHSNAQKIDIPSNMRVIACVVGFNKDNNIVISYFSSDDFIVHTIIPTGPDVQCVKLELNTTDIFENNLKTMSKLSINDYYIIMNKTIYDMSLANETINNYIFSELFTKGIYQE